MDIQIPKIKLFNKTIPKMGIGTWGIGGYMTRSPYSDYINEITQIKYQISKGLTLIDCWIAQGEGGSLELIRQGIEDFDREKLVLLCKFDIQKYSGVEELEMIFNKYLNQLQTNYIDVFQIHKPDFSKISEKEVESFLKAKIAEGKIKSFAVSNANLKDIKNIEEKIDVKLEADEILYNIFDREYENDKTIEYCQKNGIAIIAYRPLNRGMTNILTLDPKYREISANYTLTPSQLAMNWLLAQDNVLTLVKSSNRAHINENLDCMSVTVTAEDREKLGQWRHGV